MTKTRETAIEQRFSKGYPMDEKALEDIAIGLASGKYEDFTKAAKAAMANVGEKYNESNERRLREWYKNGNWAASGRQAFVEREIRNRGMAVKPKTDDPDVLRKWLSETLNEVLEGYSEYDLMVSEKQADNYGDQYMLEDLLHILDRAIGDHGRYAVEQLICSVVPAIHRFYGTSISMENNAVDENGISSHYPVTTVSFSIDASKPLPPQRWARDDSGILDGGRFKIEYSNPSVPSGLWFEFAITRFKEFYQRGDSMGLPRHMWTWPKKRLLNKDKIEMPHGA